MGVGGRSGKFYRDSSKILMMTSVIAEEENMAKWLAVIMMIAPISGFTWTVLNWKPFLNQRLGSVLSAKSGVESNIPEVNVLTRFINNVYSNGSTESQIFTRAQQIVTILSNVVTSPFLTVTK